MLVSQKDSGLIPVLIADPFLGKLDILLVAALVTKIEDVVGAVEQVDTAGVRGIGVKHGAVRILVEGAQALAVAYFHIDVLVVVIDGTTSDVLRLKRGLVIVVEVGPSRRDPFEGPPHPLLEALDLRERRPGDDNETHIALSEVRDHAAVVISPEGAVRASIFPLGCEHEVINGKLVSRAEQLDQALLAIRPLKDIGLVDILPGELTPLTGELVPELRKFFLLPQKIRTRFQPFLVRDDLCVLDHRTLLLHRWTRH